MKIRRIVGKNCYAPAEDVKLVQTALSHIKVRTKFGLKPLWDPGKIDGKNSQLLTEAIACFQQTEKLPVTGKIEPSGRCINTLKQKIPAGARATLAQAPTGISSGNSNQNPTRTQVDMELQKLSGRFNVPLKALKALVSTESDYRQFGSNGKPFVSPQSNSSAAGLGQVVQTTANLYGESYQRLLNDWKYNLFVSVKIFSAGYHHAWNRNISDLRIHAARAYGLYHDGFEPPFDRDLYRRQPRGLVGTKWENRYLSRY